jgi:hypothetical protein
MNMVVPQQPKCYRWTEPKVLPMFESYPDQSREFSQVPFWFWNDDLSETGIVRQIDDFQAHGVHAFVLHPRAGLPRHLAWMSPELLAFMRFAIEEAARRGMWVILYDEGMYPSGSSAGQVVAENPAYACRGLVHVDLTTAMPGETVHGIRVGTDGVELTEHQTLVAVVTRQRDQHRIAIVDMPIGSKIRGLHFTEDDPPRRKDHKEVDENHPLAGDLLNLDAMQCFIRLVYQGFYDAFPGHFGKTIRAIFTDEPGLMGRGAAFKCNPRPGTTGILTHVNNYLGYDFTPHLPALWDTEDPDAARLQEDYARAIRARLEETYYRPISDWCEAHGVALTGHPEHSADLGMLRYFQIPGQDVVWRYIEPGKDSAIVGPHSTMAKCASSAMLHLGRRHNLNEFAGAYGHDLTYEEYRWLALWLLIRGCNMLSPHAFYYSIRGPRIDERPRDVGPNSPWWDRYAGFAEMTGKLSWLNTDSEHVCAVAILGQDNRLPWESARVCFENQIDFNYLEDHHLGREAVLSDRGICIGTMTYRLLIVEAGYGPTAGKEAEAAVAELLESGHAVQWNPEDGPSPLLQVIAQKAGPLISVVPPSPGLRIRQVRKEGGHYVVVFNEGETSFRGKLNIPSAKAGSQIEMDTQKASAWNPDTELKIGPHECVVIVWPVCEDEP